MQTKAAGGPGYPQCAAAAAFLRAKLGTVPRTALVLGSGLGGLAGALDRPAEISYAAIPGFPAPTVSSHAGVLLCGRLRGAPVLLLSGRSHFYEGYSAQQTSDYVRVLKLLGVENLLLTNAAGAVSPDFPAGTLMAVRDHLFFSPLSPCRGPNDERFGPRFFDMSEAYDPALRRLARECAKEEGVPLAEGVYAFMAGPQYETPAEVRALRALGADAVGMSTVPEVIEAAHCGLHTLCISCLTNPAAGVSEKKLCHGDVVRAAAEASGRLEKLMSSLVFRLGRRG